MNATSSDLIGDAGRKLLEFVRNYGIIIGLASALCAILGYIIDDTQIASEARYIIIGAACFVAALLIASNIIFRVAPRYKLKCEGTEYYAKMASEELNSFFTSHRVSATDVLPVNAYRDLVKSRPHVLISICDGKSNDMIGFFDIFPLKDDPGKKLINGDYTELEILKPEHIYDKDTAGKSNHIYIGTVWPINQKKSRERLCLTCSMVPPLIRFVKKHYPPRRERVYVALAATPLGASLLNFANFDPLHEENKGDVQTTRRRARRKGQGSMFVFKYEHWRGTGIGRYMPLSWKIQRLVKDACEKDCGNRIEIIQAKEVQY